MLFGSLPPDSSAFCNAFKDKRTAVLRNPLSKQFFPCIRIQFSSVTQSCSTLCNPMDCSTPGLPVITNSRSLLKLMPIESVMPSNHLILCCLLLLLPSIFPSIRIFSNESALLIRWPSIRVSASTSVLPMNTKD